MQLWVQTDEQIIERLRRGQRYRRLTGGLVASLGIVFVAITMYFLHDIHARSLQILGESSQVVQPTTQQLEQSLDSTRFNMGFALGMLLASSLASGTGMVLGGLMLFFPNRKDQLLLKTWDNQRSNR